MATEAKDQKIILQTKHGPGTFSLAIALFQPGPQNGVEFECKPFFFGDHEIIAFRACIFSAENISSNLLGKKFWRLNGKISKILSSKNRAWYSLNEIRFYESPGQQKFFPPYFTWIYEINTRNGQLVLTNQENQ